MASGAGPYPTLSQPPGNFILEAFRAQRIGKAQDLALFAETCATRSSKGNSASAEARWW